MAKSLLLLEIQMDIISETAITGIDSWHHLNQLFPPLPHQQAETILLVPHSKTVTQNG